MSNYQKIISIVNPILKKYLLCDNCLGRLFSKQLHLSSNKLLGKKLKKNLNSTQKCYICRNLFDNLNHFLKMMIDVSSNYSFSSFSVGAMIRPSINAVAEISSELIENPNVNNRIDMRTAVYFFISLY